MNKIVRFLTAFPLAFLAVSCSQDSLPDEQQTSGAHLHEVEITLNIGVKDKMFNGTAPYGNQNREETGGRNTAPREILNLNGEQCINDLRIYVFHSSTPDGKYLYYGGGEQADGSYLVSQPGIFMNEYPWNGMPNFDDDYQYNENYERHTFSFHLRLADGYYKFLAVGREDESDYPNNGGGTSANLGWAMQWKRITYQPLDFVVGETEFHKTSLLSEQTRRTKKLHTPNFCHEIFSGIMQTASGKEDFVEVDEHSQKLSFKKEITLTRAVAGLYVLLTNIPTKVIDPYLMDEYGENYEFIPRVLQIKLSVCSRGLLLTDKTSTGKTQTDVTICKTEFFGNVDHDEWSYKDLPFFMRPSFHYKGIEVPENSVHMQNFILPVDIDLLEDEEVEATMEIRYYEGNDEEQGDFWERRIPCKFISGTDANGRPIEIDNPYVFPIKPNYIYAIGAPGRPLDLSGTSGIGSDSPARAGAGSHFKEKDYIPVTVYAN